MGDSESKSTNKKNVEDPNEENTMSVEQCKILASEKGSAAVHRCDETCQTGDERAESADWIEKQQKSVGPTKPASDDYKLIKDQK